MRIGDFGASLKKRQRANESRRNNGWHVSMLEEVKMVRKEQNRRAPRERCKEKARKAETQWKQRSLSKVHRCQGTRQPAVKKNPSEGCGKNSRREQDNSDLRGCSIIGQRHRNFYAL